MALSKLPFKREYNKGCKNFQTMQDSLKERKRQNK